MEMWGGLMFAFRSMYLASVVLAILSAGTVITAPVVVIAQSRLPQCPSNSNAAWTNCQGRSGKYVGEWKDNKYYGQGTFTFADGGKYVGAFKDGKSHGQGNETFADGTKYVGAFK